MGSKVLGRIRKKQPEAPAVSHNGGRSIPWLSLLCALMRGTPTLREHVRELLGNGPLTGVPRLLLAHVAKGDFGVFNLPVVREFERKRILVDQPVAIHLALATGQKEKARKLRSQLAQWEKQFEELYGEPPKKGVNLEVLERHAAQICELSRN